MGFYEWMLALHVLAAFAVASALVLFSVLVVTNRNSTTLDEVRLTFRVARIGGPLIGIGMGLLILIGIVLAIDSDDFQLWDGWVIAGILLWMLMGFTGGRTGTYYTDTQKLAEEGGSESEVLARIHAPTGRLWHLATVGVFLLIVLDMFFKPGA